MDTRVRHWIIQRSGDLGDVCMALCACKALKRTDPSCTIWLVTTSSHLPVAAACPHIDELFLPEDFSRISEAMHDASWRNPNFTFQELDHPRFGLDPLNQVEAYLATLRQPLCPAECKTLDLVLPPLAPGSALSALPRPPAGGRRVVFHAAQGAPNRTWPERSWQALGRKVLSEGHQLILTGERASSSGDGAFHLELPGSIDFRGGLDPLELVALLRQSDLFVASDGDSIQLAGASDVAICGIYTVVAGRCRMPFRHGQPLWGASWVEPDCPHRACHRLLSAPEHTKRLQQALSEDARAIDHLLSTWCLEADDPYHCLRDITPERVWGTMVPWLQVTPRERESALERVEALAASGQPRQALELLEALPEIPSEAATLLLRARLLQSLHRVDDSFKLLRQWLPLWPLHGGVVNLMGLASLRAGESDAAAAFFRKAGGLADAGPALARNSAYLEALQALEANAPEAAERALEAVLGTPASPDAVGEGEVAVLRLTVMLLQGRLEEGRDLADQTLRQGWENADLHFLRGELLLQLEVQPEAQRSFEKCLALDPTHALASERLKALMA